MVNIFQVTVVCITSLAGNHSPPHLPRVPSNNALVSGPAVGTDQTQSGLTPVCSCLQCPQLSKPVHFLLWELSMSFCIFLRHRVCLVDCVDLISSLYRWWEGFGSSSFATLPLGFNCGHLTSTSAYGSSTGICSWGCPGRLGSATVSARCGGDTAAWVIGILAAPGTQGSWQLRAAGNIVL